MQPKFFFVTTIPGSLDFFTGQYEMLGEVFDITAISSQREKLDEYGLQNNIKVHYIPMEREISLKTDIKGLFLFIKYFRKERPQIVHGNTPKGSLLSMLAAWLTRVPVRIYMCHGLRYQGCTGFKKQLLMMMERISCWCATDVMCVSKGVASVLNKDSITRKKPIVIWNGSVSGIDVSKFDPNKDYNRVEIRKRYGLKVDDFVLSFVGRIVADKGVNELIEAFSVLSERYKEMKLLLVGIMETDGNPISNNSLEQINNNPAIIAPGRQNNIPEILSITDIFVFPSYREGFGLSLMEAGAMGVPAISSDIIGCNEVVEDGTTGILIESHSYTSIVNAVERLYNDKDLYDKIKSQCRNSIVGRYEQQTLWGKYKDFYVNKIK